MITGDILFSILGFMLGGLIGWFSGISLYLSSSPWTKHFPPFAVGVTLGFLTAISVWTFSSFRYDHIRPGSVTTYFASKSLLNGTVTCEGKYTKVKGTVDYRVSSDTLQVKKIPIDFEVSQLMSCQRGYVPPVEFLREQIEEAVQAYNRTPRT